METAETIVPGYDDAPPAAPVDPVDFLIQAARTNYAAFVSAVHRPRYKHSTFSAEVCRAVDRFVDDVIAGKRPVLMLTAPPQHGKLFAHATPVLTANRGWVTHGALRIGDRVYRPDGTTTRVIALSPECESDMRISFTDGSVLDTHSRHEWLLHQTWTKGRPTAIIETRAIAKRGAWKGKAGKRGSRANFQLPEVAAIAGVATDLPVAPYALGVWLGDGVRTKPNITVHPDDRTMLCAVAECGYPQTNEWTHAATGVLHAEFASLREPLRQAGLYNEGYKHTGLWIPKHIPDIYFGATSEDRLQLLAGLLDSDGYIYPHNGRVTFSTCEHELAESVARLIATFGWRVTTTWFEPSLSTSGIQGKQPVAQVCFQPSRRIPCRLDRKANAFKLDALQRKRAVASVAHGNYGLGRCIQVEHSDGMYLVGDRLVPTHNSSLVARCLPPYLFGRLTGILPAVRIASASYAAGLAQRNRRDAQTIMDEPIYREIFPHTSLIDFKGVDNATDGLEVPGGGWLRGVGIGGGLTGFSVDVGVIDDCVKDAVEALSDATQQRNRDWYDSVFMTRLQENSGQIIIGTPWSANDLLAHIRKTMGDDPRFTLISFPALNYPDEIGYRPDLPTGPLVPKLHSEIKLRETKKITAEFWWSAVYQQTPMADVGAIFKKDYVQYYRRAELPATFKRIVMSVDAAFKDLKSSDYVCVGVWAQALDDNTYLLDWRREKLSFTATAAAIVDLKTKYARASKIYIEDAANGPALIDMLSKKVHGIEAVPPLGSKEARAHAVSWVWENRLVWLPHPDERPGIVPVVAEITSFPDVKNDDAVDMMDIALHQLHLRSPIAALITQDVLDQAMLRG
jgi:predicted phage terminase large subunit-like protein